MNGRMCMDCRYWDAYDVDPDSISEGVCRRYPPYVPIFAMGDGPLKDARIEMTTDTPLMGYPMTFGDEWCGEWKPRKEAYEQ